MIVCSGSSEPFHCPTKWELWRSLLAKLPRGRAWQTHEEILERYQLGSTSEVGEYEVSSSGLGQEPTLEQLTVMQQFWAAFAGALEFVHSRACALLAEFYCSTTTELRTEWGIEFGFPDPCEAYDSLCAKVTAREDPTLAGLRAVVRSRFGVEIEIDDSGTDPEVDPDTIRVRIPAEGPAPIPFHADALVADCTPPCPPVPDNIICLIERLRHAHVKPIYEVVE